MDARLINSICFLFILTATSYKSGPPLWSTSANADETKAENKSKRTKGSEDKSKGDGKVQTSTGNRNGKNHLYTPQDDECYKKKKDLHALCQGNGIGSGGLASAVLRNSENLTQGLGAILGGKLEDALNSAKKLDPRACSELYQYVVFNCDGQAKDDFRRAQDSCKSSLDDLNDQGKKSDELCAKVKGTGTNCLAIVKKCESFLAAVGEQVKDPKAFKAFSEACPHLAAPAIEQQKKIAEQMAKETEELTQKLEVLEQQESDMARAADQEERGLRANYLNLQGAISKTKIQAKQAINKLRGDQRKQMEEFQKELDEVGSELTKLSSDTEGMRIPQAYMNSVDAAYRFCEDKGIEVSKKNSSTYRSAVEKKVNISRSALMKQHRLGKGGVAQSESRKTQNACFQGRDFLSMMTKAENERQNSLIEVRLRRMQLIQRTAAIKTRIQNAVAGSTDDMEDAVALADNDVRLAQAQTEELKIQIQQHQLFRNSRIYQLGNQKIALQNKLKQIGQAQEFQAEHFLGNGARNLPTSVQQFWSSNPTNPTESKDYTELTAAMMSHEKQHALAKAKCCDIQLPFSLEASQHRALCSTPDPNRLPSLSGGVR